MWLKMDGHEWKLIKVDEMAKDCRKWMRPISPNGDGPWNLNRGSSMTIKTPWKLILWNNLCPLFQLFHESYSEMQSASFKIKDDSCDVSGAASDSKFGASEPDFPSKTMERSRKRTWRTRMTDNDGTTQELSICMICSGINVILLKFTFFW